MSIGRLIRNLPPEDGGIDGLTPGEEAELDDLLNGPHRLCECGQPGCGSPLITPKSIRRV